MALSVQKAHRLPLTFAGLGVAYFAMTQLQKPSSPTLAERERWEKHVKGARFALAAGLGAAAILWWAAPERAR